MTVTLTRLGAYTDEIDCNLSDISRSTTFNLDDWVAKTPKSILAKNFGVPESVFDKVPEKNPYILNGTASTRNVTGGNGQLTGNSSYVYHTFQHDPEPVPGGGGIFYKIDSTNFPVSKTIAATFVTLEPKGLRELHWHPTVSILGFLSLQ